MGRIIAITNQKGGVGKTTTAVNLAASLAVAEKKVLLVDMDPQGNATQSVGVERNGLPWTVYDLLLGVEPTDDVLKPTALDFLRCAPSTRDLVGVEVEIVSEADRATRLRSGLGPLAARFDFVIVDAPPSLGLLTLNCLAAADAIIIPLQCEYFAMEGLGALTSTADLVKKSYNPRLETEGILLTMFDPRNNLSHQVAKEVRDFFGSKVFRTIIPRNVRLGEAPSFGKPVILYDAACPGAHAYLALAKELLARHR
ncbi:MAG: ParA family protein [Deltaproteobacteria bacterium]|nr:ParA family protein [Deltaproteobacteria bacterium]